jgi:hypothetical protein
MSLHTDTVTLANVRRIAVTARPCTPALTEVQALAQARHALHIAALVRARRQGRAPQWADQSRKSATA